MTSPVFFSQITPERPKREIFARKIIVVEGIDECWMMDKLFGDLGLDPSIYQIVEFNGKPNLLGNLENLGTQDPFLDDAVDALAIIIDADGSLAKAKYDLEKAAQEAGFGPIPLAGFNRVSPTRSLHVGGFIMPDNSGGGALETLLMASVSSQPTAIAAEKFVADHAPSKATDIAKRASQVFLAAQKELSRGAGWGARKGYFDLKAGCMKDLLSFIDLLKAI